MILLLSFLVAISIILLGYIAIQLDSAKRRPPVDLDEGFAAVLAHLGLLADRIQELETQLSAQQDHIDSSVSAINTAADAIDAKIATLEADAHLDFTGLDSAVARVEAVAPAPAPAPEEPPA